MASWWRSRRPSMTPGHRVYAIGDVHGRYDLLAELIFKIAAEQPRLEPARTFLVFLGDLVDRGPQSAKVLQLVRWGGSAQPRAIVLKGNHEEMLVEAWHGDRDALVGWLDHGGVATLTSFAQAGSAADFMAGDPDDRNAYPETGEEAGTIATIPAAGRSRLDAAALEATLHGGARLDEAEIDDALALLRATIAPDMIDWLETLPTAWRMGDYAFVHAGIRPGLPIERQDDADLMWIREEFLDYAGAHDAVIVHGHTVTEEVEIHPNRIGIDTGAYRTGRLSALCLWRREQRVISTAVQNVLDLSEIAP